MLNCSNIFKKRINLHTGLINLLLNYFYFKFKQGLVNIFNKGT